MVSLLIKVSIKRPTALIPIPMDARILGSLVSDNFPENDATTAITIGCALKIKPASLGDKPLTYCKYKLKMNVMANMAAYFIKTDKF